MDKQIEVFEKTAKVEHQIWGLQQRYKGVGIVDIQSGEVLETIPGPEGVLFVLDGDHVITGDFHVFSLREKRNIQDLKEMREVAGEREHWQYSVGVFLPAPQKYAFAYREHGYEVFDPRRAMKKFIFYIPMGNFIQVWDWNTSAERSKAGNVLRKEYTFDQFVDSKGERNFIASAFSLPKQAQVLGPNEIGVAGDNSFFIFDTQTRKILREFTPRTLANFFILPGGRLGLTEEVEHAENLFDLTAVLDKGNRKFKRVEVLTAVEPTAILPTAVEEGGSLIMKRKKKDEYLFLVSENENPWVAGSSSERPEDYKEVKVGEETPEYNQYWREEKEEGMGEFCHCSFYGADVAYLEGLGKKAKFTFIDLEIKKEKQTLKVPYSIGLPCYHLPGNRYHLIMEDKHGNRFRQLLEYDEKKEKYSLGAKSTIEHFLPLSKRQKKLMECSLNEMFKEVKAPIPKEVVGVIAGFI